MLRTVQEFLELLDRYRLVKESKRTGPELLHARDAAAVDFRSMFGGESGLRSQHRLVWLTNAGTTPPCVILIFAYPAVPLFPIFADHLP